MKIVSPVSYQGAKGRLAPQIVDIILPTDDFPFYDMCCGSGTVSIEMIERGFPADEVIMVDAGPWGTFWESIGEETFRLDVLYGYINTMPADLSLVRDWAKALSEQSASIDTAEVFILLQASSFGGKAIWIEEDRWTNTSFRSYWMPTETSSRRSPVNPMMPMPDTLKRRTWDVMQRMGGAITGMCANVEDVAVLPGSTVYIDPPYSAGTGYGHSLDIDAVATTLRTHSKTYVSEGRLVGTEGTLLHAGRSKGGISGDRKVQANEEWLSWA